MTHPEARPRPLPILFIHKDFPGQFLHLAKALAAAGHDVRAICDARQPELQTPVPGIPVLRYLDRLAPSQAEPLARPFDAAVRRGQFVARIAQSLAERGFRPRLVVAHPGWGESLYVKDVFPETILLHYCEYYYHAQGADVGFDPEFPATFEDVCRARTLNALNLLHLEACDHGVSPTRWQAGLHPPAFRAKISVMHEGIDTVTARPNPDARVTLPDGRVLALDNEVVTFVTRNLEPYRGFHSFMRALPSLMARRPRLQVLVLGGDGVSYGHALPEGESYRARLLAELDGQIDPHRLHFLGLQPRQAYLDVLAVSTAHVYLTYPFVLSWSMLEAMASGCVVVGSATPPVREVIEDGRNGLLVDFFDPPAIAATIERVLVAPDRMAGLRRAARETVLRLYDRDAVALPQTLALIDRLLEGGNVPVGDVK